MTLPWAKVNNGTVKEMGRHTILNFVLSLLGARRERKSDHGGGEHMDGTGGRKEGRKDIKPIHCYG